MVNALCMINEKTQRMRGIPRLCIFHTAHWHFFLLFFFVLMRVHYDIFVLSRHFISIFKFQRGGQRGYINSCQVLTREFKCICSFLPSIIY